MAEPDWENEGGYVNDDDLMTPGDVAKFFKVNPKTVQRWDKAGKLKSFRTLGGHRRFYRSEVEALVAEDDHGDDTVQSGAS